MRVVKIEVVNKRYRVYKVSFEGEGALLSVPVHLEYLERKSIQEGISFTEEDILLMLNESAAELLGNRMADYLAIRSHSEKEIKDYLKRTWYKSFRKHLSKNLRKQVQLDEIVNALLTKLKESELVSNENFAREFVQSRKNFKPRGKMMIVNELVQKGINRNTAKQIVDEEIPDETALLNDLLFKRYRKEVISKKDQKIIRYLQGKGFAWDSIKSVIEE